MGASNIRDILTSFSPSLDFFAISTGDGRIKVLLSGIAYVENCKWLILVLYGHAKICCTAFFIAKQFFTFSPV